MQVCAYSVITVGYEEERRAEKKRKKKEKRRFDQINPNSNPGERLQVYIESGSPDLPRLTGRFCTLRLLPTALLKGTRKANTASH